MMSVVSEVDLRELVLGTGAFGPQEISQIRAALADDPASLQSLRDSVGDLEAQESRTPAASAKLGVCLFLMGRFRAAANYLTSSDGGAQTNYYLGQARVELQEYAAALEAFDAAARGGYDSGAVALARADAQRRAGDSAAALQTLDSLSGAVEQTAEYLYQRSSTVAALRENPQEVIALLERAVESDDTHAGALFGLALENDRRGNDATALVLYEKAAAQVPTNVGVLINLGVLYEDMGKFDRASRCYQRVLTAFPDHPRARLFLRDADASRDMYYDAEARREQDRLAQVLSVPVTDFELSVRSRNCLQKMGIMTLGDLTRTTEQQLLSSKNFGETSLVEIREMLTSKGLSLGQFAGEQREEEPAYDAGTLSDDERAFLDRPISDLNLSVRARKCMVRLGLNTIGELIRRTGDDLLECKNFGVTSLNEVREKLTVHGLKLRGD